VEKLASGWARNTCGGGWSTWQRAAFLQGSLQFTERVFYPGDGGRESLGCWAGVSGVWKTGAALRSSEPIQKTSISDSVVEMVPMMRLVSTTVNNL